MTLDEAKQLCQGEILIDVYGDKWKILKITTWKRSPNKILISCRFGLYKYNKFDEHDLHKFVGKQDGYYG